MELDPTVGLQGYDPGRTKDRVLSSAEIRDLWNWLDSPSLAPDPADILRLELLLGARCGEISGLDAGEIDRGSWYWTLPAERSKNKRVRITPLVGMARAIVASRLSTRPAGPLFASERGTPLTSAHIGHWLLVRQGKIPIEKFTTHDLRRTVATMLVETGTPLELVAAVVGHEPGGKETRTLVRHYVRTDLIARKAQVLTNWDSWLADQIARAGPSKPLETSTYGSLPLLP